jgi:NADPH:quinone reductase-like Zn-dependent oxidoreductase
MDNVKSYRSLNEFGIDNLKLTEDKIARLGSGEVLVKLHATSLNYRDLLVVKGLYNPKLKKPNGVIPLSDGTGEIVELGEGVTRFSKGDRVAGIFMQTWLDGECDQAKAKSALGGTIDGVLTTHKIFRADSLVKLPDHLSFAEGATLPCAAVTAWHALVASGGLKAGDTVLLQGTGGVSIFALQFAKLSGATVIITSSNDQKLERAKKLGADHLINYKKEPDWSKKVLELTDGRGVDHIVEVGGAGTLGKSLHAVRIAGKIALIGVLSGAGEINPMPILMKNIQVQGIYVGSRAMFEAMNKAITTNNLHPIIDRTFSFSQVKEALQNLESAAHFGKIVIQIS